MIPYADLLGLFYLALLLGLAVYGLNSLITAVLFLTLQKKTAAESAVAGGEPWPSVTVQLPVFNEKYTMDRLIHSITRLDYPRDRLQIQVLDDSTDDTSLLSTRMVEENRALGINIHWVHRKDRSGFKAGALKNGLQSASGDLVAVFDADFIPEPDWLKRTVPYFRDPKLGCLQTRWGHTNREYNSLTAAQAVGIDGHFIVEQTVRSRHGLFLNFNGTAGIWRRSCIEEAGGWQADTLTEDLDLSYRAQLCGWQIGYLPDVVVRAELPAFVEAFKKQQFRWAKGSSQVVRKLLPKVLDRPDLPWFKRLGASLHLTGYFVHLLMVAVLLVTLPVGLFAPRFFGVLPIPLLAMFGPPLLYSVAGSSDTPSLRERLALMPLLTLIGFGISLSTAWAVMEGLIDKGGDFIRTPKFDLGNRGGGSAALDRTYRQPLSRLVWGEIGLGLYALLTIVTLIPSMGWKIIPSMAVYSLGYFYVAGLNLLQHWQAQLHRAPLTFKQEL